jgi:hydroxyacylglutathione hydrolase
MEVRSIRTPGLGDATYVLVHEGTGVVVDPQRDVGRFLDASEAAGAEVRWVLETHLHNDYVSGGRELARRAGAELVLPAAAVVPFEHTPAFHQEELKGDGLTIRPIHTPGHTPEHTSYLVLIDGEPVALFSGGSLLVAAAGRSDLLGMDRARQLALAQYRSVRRLAELPDAVELFPTHGEGSFCTASGAGQTTSTIGREKATNPVLRYPDAEAFVAGELAGLAPYPRYYAHMGPINLRGPEPMGDPDVPELTAGDVAAMDEVTIVDGRPAAAYAAGHIPGSLNVALGDQFGVWVGWVVAFNTPLVLVLDDDQDSTEAVTQLARIGFDRVRGVLRGVKAWAATGAHLATFRRVDREEFLAAVQAGDVQVLDVRAPDEWAAGHLDGSLHAYTPDLVDTFPAGLELDRPVWVACAGGGRAAIAASLLQARGFAPVLVDGAGIPDALQALAAPAA